MSLNMGFMEHSAKVFLSVYEFTVPEMCFPHDEVTDPEVHLNDINAERERRKHELKKIRLQEQMDADRGGPAKLCGDVGDRDVKFVSHTQEEEQDMFFTMSCLEQESGRLEIRLEEQRKELKAKQLHLQNLRAKIAQQEKSA